MYPDARLGRHELVSYASDSFKIFRWGLKRYEIISRPISDKRDKFTYDELEEEIEKCKTIMREQTVIIVISHQSYQSRTTRKVCTAPVTYCTRSS